MMKRIVLVFLLICFICCGCTKKNNTGDDLSNIIKRDKLIVGVRNDAEPFGFIDKNKKLNGYDVELAKLIAHSILGDESKIQFVPVNTSNRIMKLNSNEVDIVVATMSITSQRQMLLNFSIPYYVAGQAIMVKKGSNITSLSDLEGKKAIIVFGSTSERSLRTKVPEITTIGYKTYNEAFKALKENKAEAIIADDTILLGYALKDNSVKILPKRYSKEPYAVALRKTDESKNLLEQINYILENLQSTGRLNRLQEKWKLK